MQPARSRRTQLNASTVAGWVRVCWCHRHRWRQQIGTHLEVRLSSHCWRVKASSRSFATIAGGKLRLTKQNRTR